jgi:hypothetical protein
MPATFGAHVDEKRRRTPALPVVRLRPSFPLWVPDARSMARFMWYFQTNAAREVARRTDWPDGIWSDRYTSIPVSDEPAAQVDRLRYVLARVSRMGW